MILWEKTGDESTSTFIFVDLAGLSCEMGDYHKALVYLEQSEQRCRKLGTKGYLLQTLVQLGDVARALKKLDRAESYYRESLPLIDETFYYPWLPRTYQSLGYIMLSRGSQGQAVEYFHKAFHSSQVQNFKHGQVHFIAGLAARAVLNRQFNYAARLFGAFFTQPESIHSDIKIDQKILSLVDHAEIDHYLERCKESMDRVAFEKAWVEGSSLCLEKVLGELMDKETENFTLISR
jgi:tetratricopeptide (TPR) repeat protein